MPLSPRPSSKGTNSIFADRSDPTLPVILEFQSPSTAIVNTPMPFMGRGMARMISTMVIASFVALGVIEVDKVVTTPGRVVSLASTIVVQPLETSIVRTIEVREGEVVRAGQLLARLDPTFAAADVDTLAAQMKQLTAQVARLQAEAEIRPFAYTGLDPSMSLQAAIFAQRKAEHSYKLENYQLKADSLHAAMTRARSDAAGYRNRLGYARSLEDMRKELERLNVGSKLNTLSAMDTRVEMQRNVESADQIATAAQRDLNAMHAEKNGYVQTWRADVSEKLSEATGRLSDATEALNKAQLRQRLVELRADGDATVLTIGRVSVGSVLAAGQQFITLTPLDAPLEVEVNIPGSENGYVHVGDSVSIKFDTLPYSEYGMAKGVVRTVSADSFNSQDEQRNPTGAAPPLGAAGSNVVWYRARVTLDQINLHDTPPNFRLNSGMPITADILVGKRSVLRYLLGRAIPLASEGMREP